MSLEKIGDVRVAQGDRAGVLEAYEQSRAIADQLAARDPANAEWQRDLSVSLNKMAISEWRRVTSTARWRPTRGTSR